MAQSEAVRDENGQVALDNFPTTSDDPLADFSLPERDFLWEGDLTSGNGPLSLVFPEGDISLNGCYLAHQQGGLVVEGAEEYLDEHADRELEIPATYTAIDEFDTYVGMATAIGSNYGIGIDGWLVEIAIRLATGGGRYSTDDLTLIACDHHPFILRSPDGDFLFTLNSVGKPRRDDYQPPRANVGPITIEEGSSKAIDGMKHLLTDVRTHFGIDPATYEGRSSNSHRIAFDSDGPDVDQRRITGLACQRRQAITTDPTDVLGPHEIDTAFDEHFECRLDRTELAHRIGEEVRGGICIGYSTSYHDPRQSRCVSMSGRVKANVNYHYLTLRETSAPEIRFETKTETIAEFDTESKSYNPIGSHL